MISEREFLEAQERLVSAWNRGDLTAALAEIESLLREGTSEMKGQCLFYRGMIREDQGALPDAKQDWLAALDYAREGTFLRCELQHKIGEAFEKLNAGGEAANWYRRALRTCSSGDEFSGNRTLAYFLRVNDGSVSPDDRPLVASVIEKSWRVLELPGKPDLTDLPRSINTLTGRFEEIVAEAKADS